MEGTSQSMSWNSDGMTTVRKHDLEIRLQYRTILHVVLVLLQPSKRNPKEEEEETVAILPHISLPFSLQKEENEIFWIFTSEQSYLWPPSAQRETMTALCYPL